MVKKTIWTLLVVIILMLIACSSDKGDSTNEEIDTVSIAESETNNETNHSTADEMPDLELKIQKADEVAGITIDNNEVYQYIERIINADPKAGVKDDFAIYPLQVLTNGEGESKLLFIGISRINEAIRSISFDLTLGNGEDYVYKDTPIQLTEEQVGIIEPHTAFPIMLDITPDAIELFNSIAEPEISFENSKAEYVE